MYNHMHSKNGTTTFPIVVVGSGNEECIIKLDSEFLCDKKYIAEYIYLFGGSGVNFTFRLINAGYRVIPILPIGKDTIGKKLRSLIVAQNKGYDSDLINLYLNSDHFFIDNCKTAKSTIIIDNKGHRTVFSESTKNHFDFLKHIEKCLRFFKSESNTNYRIQSLVVGHIQSDHPQSNLEDPGKITKYLIATAHESLVFTNLGHSQICMGVKFWEKHLKKVDVFQLNISEVKYFFEVSGYNYSLFQIINWFYQKKITAVITISELGAIGIFNKEKKGIIYSSGYKLDGFVDSTGAGDAFLAGIVSSLHGKKEFNMEDFCHAIEEGQLWAAYACTQIGASKNCPNKNELMCFENDQLLRCKVLPQIISIQNAKNYIEEIDK